MFPIHLPAAIGLPQPRFSFAFLLAGLLTCSGFAGAEERSPEKQADKAEGTSVVTIKVNLDAFAESQLGSLLIDAGTELASQEMGKDPEEAMEAVIETLGFNPFEQDAKLTATITDIEDPIEGLRLDLQLNDSSGNLEGLLLAAPEYRSRKHGEHTIHAATIDGKDVFIAFHTADSGKKRIFASVSEQDIEKSLEQAGNPSASDLHSDEMPSGRFINIQTHSLPAKLAKNTPFTNITERLSTSSLSLGEDGDDLVIALSLVAKEEEQAVQIQQLAQGAVAMVGLFKEEIQKEFDGKDSAHNLLSVLDQIVIERDGATVVIESKIPQEALLHFLRDEAGLPL